MTRPPLAPPDLDDPRVVAALEQYMAALESGRPPDRATFLRSHGEIAAALEECLEGLEFLQHAAPPTPTPDRLDEYRLIREVGRGGMGVVYEAERLPDRRRVAVKTLAAAGWQPADRERFRNEALAAGSLDHPNVVPVLAVGRDRGVDYFVMPLIVGSSLAQLIDPDFHPAASTLLDTPSGEEDPTPLPAAVPVPTPATRPPDSPAAAAKLALQAAEALAHAHARGVVHRDVKPANCLVDARGHLWVLDFGLARRDGADRLTRTGAMVGTLPYMAPEQVDAGRGVVDHRTDLYGLGATLYELLTRRPVFTERNRERLVTAILTEEPPPPRRIDPAVPYDLETITLKLLAKEPASRYACAGDVVADLRRFLTGLPIAARRPSWGEIAARWAGRHRSIVAVAAAGVLVLFVLQSVNTWRVWRRDAIIRAERQTVRAAADDMYTAFAEQILSRVDGLEDDHREFLLKARDQYQRLAGLENAGPEDGLAAARAWRRVGDIDLLVGDTDGAEAAYREAQARLAALPADPAEVRREAAVTANNFGNLHRLTGRVEAAGRLYDQAAAAFRGLAAAPSATADGFELAGVEHNRGLVWQLQDRHPEAVAAFRGAQTLFAQLAVAHPSRPEYVEHAAFVGHNLAVSLHALGRPAEAAGVFGDSLLLWEKALASPGRPAETRRRAGRTRVEQARVLIALGRPAEAQAAAEQAVKGFEPAAAGRSVGPRHRLDEATARRVLAEAHAAQRRPADARREIDRAKECLSAAGAAGAVAAGEWAAAYCVQAELDAAENRRESSEAAVREAALWADRIADAATARPDAGGRRPRPGHDQEPMSHG